MNHPFMPVARQMPSAWVVDALCAQVSRGDEWFDEDTKIQNFAKAVCRLCPVQTECLNFALRTGQRFGVWGGVPASRFAALRADRGIRVRLRAPHGTAARYKQHYRDGETPCERCKSADGQRRDYLRSVRS